VAVQASKGARQAPARSSQRATEEARRNRILDCAAVLFDERGYSGTTTQDIADAAHITKRTLYRYLPSKEDILFEIHSRFIDDRAGDGATAIEGATPVDDVVAFLRHHIQVVIEHRHEIKVFFEEVKHLSDPKRTEISSKRNAYESHFVDALRRGADDGSLRISDPPLVARLILGGLTEIYRWYRPDADLSADELTDGIIAIVLHGIARGPYSLAAATMDGVPAVRTPEEIVSEPNALIWRAATAMFSSIGYQRSTTQALVDAAGVTKGALFYHLGHKEGVLELVHSVAADEAIRVLDAIPKEGMPAAEVLSLMARTHCAYLTIYREASAIAGTEIKYLSEEHQAEARVRQHTYSGYFREALVRGLHRDEFKFTDVRMASGLLLGILNSVHRWYQPSGGLSPAELGVITVDLVLGGVAQPR
jgi:AcrR family transcriptional regulator